MYYWTMQGSLQTIFLSGAKRYLREISRQDRATIGRDIHALAAFDQDVDTKQLRGPIRELIVKHHRITYFEYDSALYFVRGFHKKSTKTPKQEIDYAEEVCKKVMHGIY